MLGVPEEEQQPGDTGLRHDVDLDVPDPGRADLPGGADLPEPGTARGRCRGDDAGTSQRPPLLRRERQLDARAEFGEFDAAHGSGCAAMALHRLGRP